MFEKYEKNYNCKVAVYVPSTINVNQAFDNSKQVLELSILFSKTFGGVTCVNASGGWISDEHGYIRENVTIVYSFTDYKTAKENENFIVECCERIKRELNQEAISLEFNNTLYFI